MLRQRIKDFGLPLPRPYNTLFTRFHYTLKNDRKLLFMDDFAPHVTVATVIENAGRFLLVEEWSSGQLVYNQPAGHLDPGETLLEAAVRETFEETGWQVELTGIVGSCLYKAPLNGETYYRTTFAARALGYGLAGLRVDGNDALACYAAERWAANRARANAGPTLIEFFTYRAEGHSTSDDPSGYRSAQEREEWPLGDPIMRLKRHLIGRGVWSVEQQEQMDKECVDAVKEAVKEAAKNGILGHGLHQPFETMFEDVFEEMPWHLREQADQADREREIKWPDAEASKS